MELTNLQLHHFRNYGDLALTFQSGVNVFLGENAQGKTNLLESIYVLALARSHRTNNDKDLIQWGQKEASVSGRVEHRLGQTPISLQFSSKGKHARVNHLDQSRLSDYIGQLNIIVFAPEDLALVKGSPSVRRRFIDMEFGQMNPAYLHNTSQYRQILKERNAYLKRLQLKQTSDRIFLDVLTDQLVHFGSRVVAARADFIQRLEKAAAPIHEEISDRKERLNLAYQTPVTSEDVTALSIDELAQRFRSALDKQVEREVLMGTTLLGPHRDDLQLLVNGNDVAVFGSQGQQRTSALSLKLAEIELMHEETGEYPVLLLDDVLSELDASRQTHLLLAIQDKVQTFLTAPSLSEVARQLIDEPKVFQVNAGSITEETQA